MAGDQVDVTQRNDAWVSVLAPSGEQAGEADDSVEPAGVPNRSTRPRQWAWLSIVAMLLFAGVAGIVVGTTSILDRHLPELGDARGVDGDPPAIFVQVDSPSNSIERVAGELLERFSSWPTVLIAPIGLAAVLGLLIGWIRWRWGRSWAAERRALRLQAETQRLLAHDLEKSLRLDTAQARLVDARNEIAYLSGELDRAGSAAHANLDLQEAIEARTREVDRLATDLEDALAERDHLESEVEQLKADLTHLTEQSAEAVETHGKLDAATDLVAQQRRKISSLEDHLDRVRRRVAELASEARSASQLRAAWAQAEGIIADLNQQLTDSEPGRQLFKPATAESIVGDTSRVGELEALLNEAADVIETSQEQLRQTRFQVRELDAALARADARDHAWQTEVELLTTEIEQAANMIARLQELPERQRHAELMLSEMRSALDAERERSASLEQQLRVVSARAYRLETHLLGDRTGAEPVLDLTDEAKIPAA
jgi:chromosome segregation ATPase